MFKTLGSLWLNFPIHGSSTPDGICPGEVLFGAECKPSMQVLRAPKLCDEALLSLSRACYLRWKLSLRYV